ncbi:hypothetical protein, partial [Arthrobacter sp. H14]|uniref:hypothetical protein n=1 Tax=Arthrobacter sp. H14 TaxID=1312959 RepID=UPI00068556F4
MAATKRYVVASKSGGDTARTEAAPETLQRYREIVSEMQALEARNPLIRAYSSAESGAKPFHAISLDRYGRRLPLTTLSRLRRGSRMLPNTSILSSSFASTKAVIDPRVAAIRTVTETLAKEMLRLGLDLSDVDTLRLVRSLLHALPRSDSSELADLTGPFYDTNAMISWLGISRQALEKKVRSGKLLACMTSDRVRLYPVWQFTDFGDTLPHFVDVLSVLSQGTKDGWTIALWMVTKVDQLSGKSAVEWLASG